MFAGAQPHMQLEYQERMYRVVYAPQPNRTNYNNWGFLRLMHHAQAEAERWECMSCERALPAVFVVCNV
jgi:hypothetical protein